MVVYDKSCSDCAFGWRWEEKYGFHYKENISIVRKKHPEVSILINKKDFILKNIITLLAVLVVDLFM